MTNNSANVLHGSYLTDNGGGDAPNGPVGTAGASLLIPNITDARSTLESLNLPKTLPIGTADGGSFFNNQVLQAVDYGVRTSRTCRSRLGDVGRSVNLVSDGKRPSLVCQRLDRSSRRLDSRFLPAE